MRLTEKIENLKRRAANSVLAGKEEEAVELLVQKKQLVQALERLKARFEVLDKLSTKINEVLIPINHLHTIFYCHFPSIVPTSYLARGLSLHLRLLGS